MLAGAEEGFPRGAGARGGRPVPPGSVKCQCAAAWVGSGLTASGGLGRPVLLLVCVSLRIPSAHTGADVSV